MIVNEVFITVFKLCYNQFLLRFVKVKVSALECNQKMYMNKWIIILF